jgi:antitoxin (DNA-binding transcriptional repressor) of toxin-antitoxin stability system
MATVRLTDAKAGFSNIIYEAAAGEFVTITKPAAVIVRSGAAEGAEEALRTDRPSLVQYLKSFPVDIELDDGEFARNSVPSRDIDL